MSSDFTRSLLAPLPTHPALGMLQLAALAAGTDSALDAETLDLMRAQVEAETLAGVPAAALWPELARGLMAQAPSRMLRALRECGALALLLPEVAALFGVPQSADDPAEVDIGEHVLRVLDEAARVNAPLPVRVAALLMNVGKSDSPREHLPSHYRHIERGRPRIEAFCARFGLDADCRDLALLAIAEVERVHRAAEMRAGSIAAMLERVDAFERPARFAALLAVCSCDFHAYPGRAARPYPKATLLGIALRACAWIDAESDDADALLEARALAIAAALRSERWDEAANDGD